jgi:hypothetical protein
LGTARVALPALAILGERRRCEHERSDENEGALRHIERLSNSAASPSEDIFSGKSRAST